jgi:hypothetical protein
MEKKWITIVAEYGSKEHTQYQNEGFEPFGTECLLQPGKLQNQTIVVFYIFFRKQVVIEDNNDANQTVKPS